jgi:phosphatidylglycerophosphate synthase
MELPSEEMLLLFTIETGWPQGQTVNGEESMKMKAAIPWCMVVFRCLLGPAIAIVARLAHPQIWLGAMIAAGFLSDVYDGILARRWKTDTDALRVADSAVDIVFYLGILAAVVERHWPAVRERWGLLIAVLSLEVIRMVFDWLKFRRMASYHSYTAKAWGILLAAATVALLCFDSSSWILTLALAWGIVCDLEGLAMSLILPKWTRDVKTLSRALAIRRCTLA